MRGLFQYSLSSQSHGSTHLHMRASQSSRRLLRPTTEQLYQSICGLIVLPKCTSAAVEEKRETTYTSLANFSIQYLSRQLSSHRLGSVSILLSRTAPSYACLYLARYLPSPSPLHWPEGGERQWQGSLHHKTPNGHCPQQLPHNITTTLSTNKRTGPVCHGTGTGRGKERQSRERQEWVKEEIRDQKVSGSWEKSKWKDPVCPGGPKHNYSHAEILDICISMTQIMFAWTQKDCIKSKVEKVWWMSDWSLRLQSFLLLPQRPGISVLVWWQWVSSSHMEGFIQTCPLC